MQFGFTFLKGVIHEFVKAISWTFRNEVGFSVVQKIVFIRLRIVVIPRHKVIKNKDQNTWKFGDYNLQNDLNSFSTSQNLEF